MIKTKARFYHAVLEAHLGKTVKVDMKAELFSYAIDEDAETDFGRCDTQSARLGAA